MKRIKVRSSRIGALSLLLGLSLVAVSLIHPLGVGAATLTVMNTADSGNGSLRAAITAAAPGDTINFALPAGSVITLTLPSGSLVINKSLMITGPGANQLTVARSSAGGTGDFRVFDISTGSNNVTISGLTISNGNLAATSGASGGGILNQSSGVVNLTADTISNNTIDSGGGVGGGIASTAGTLNITNCTISGNTTGTSSEGGGIAVTTGGTLNVTNSTISDNTVGATSGAGISNRGTATLTFDTITNNTTGTSPTFTGTGGGFANFGTGTIRDTIIANNSAATGPDVSGTITSQGYNLIRIVDSNATITSTTGDQFGTAGSPIDPMLGPLVNNGGPTFTRALLTGSKAIDKAAAAVNPATGLPVTTDQRGFARPFDNPALANAPGGNGSDIGAFEVQAAPTAVGSGISGTVTNNGGAPVAGVVVRLGGSGTDFTITDASGHYDFDNLNPDGFYTVTPSRVDLSFSPSSHGISLAGNRAEAVFTATANGQPGANPLDMPEFFVRQQYVDFLNREPDATGFKFWTNEITSCGSSPQCVEVKRINVSAAFYLSIEFQETGYLVERIYKASYGDAMGASTLGGTHQLAVPIVRLNEFLPDTREIGQGVVVTPDDSNGWMQLLENNKQAFAAEFVQRSRFATAFQATLTPAEFVDMLFANAGVTPSATDRNAAIGEFGAATNTADTGARGRTLRRVAENSTLTQREFNRAFVLIEYLGYLRRNPNDSQDTDYSGYDFWLTKLNQFNGNFQNAEMVKAFNSSSEYRQRFGQ